MLVLPSAYQECPVTFKLMTSQVVERARPLSSHIGPLERERVTEQLIGRLKAFDSAETLDS